MLGGVNWKLTWGIATKIESQGKNDKSKPLSLNGLIVTHIIESALKEEKETDFNWELILSAKI